MMDNDEHNAFESFFDDHMRFINFVGRLGARGWVRQSELGGADKSVFRDFTQDGYAQLCSRHQCESIAHLGVCWLTFHEDDNSDYVFFSRAIFPEYADLLRELRKAQVIL
ncbi:hypothetical protein [Cupriavidus numazuensis]|uniref:Uncharacterized protein n=1 Tax=Cupriavidus numazuensis TaxID=221992 RepID=A0ABN7QFV4_9BURK|nr:hypothetical protein [Cupriavidus numazuensis]CAG2160388.1 hypothetical protein LMG26411_07450 [Cupriavidus numazuensis]